MNSTMSCTPLPTWRLWADVWILEQSAGRQSMRGKPGCRRPARCIMKWVCTIHFTSLFFTLRPATHLLRPGLPATTSSTVLHHAPAFWCPPQYPTAPTSTMIRRHLNWLPQACSHDILHALDVAPSTSFNVSTVVDTSYAPQPTQSTPCSRHLCCSDVAHRMPPLSPLSTQRHLKCHVVTFPSPHSLRTWISRLRLYWSSQAR